MTDERESISIKRDTPRHLISDPLTFENIMNNPVIKPIAEADHTLLALEEMTVKKTTDLDRDTKWVDSAIHDIPQYQSSALVSRMLEMHRKTGDIVKLQDLQIATLVKVIKEMFEIVKKEYGVLVKEAARPQASSQRTSIDYEEYLKSLSEHSDENISMVAKSIYEEYLKKTDLYKEDERFKYAAGMYYKGEADKEKRKIVGKILRNEI